jgi:hypothetical protein
VGGAAAHCRAALAVAPPRMITSSSMALSLSRENPLSLACCRWNKKQSTWTGYRVIRLFFSVLSQLPFCVLRRS